MATKITSPVADFTGATMFGPVPVQFAKGVAVVDEVSDGLRSYLVGAGYTLEDVEEPAPAEEKPAAEGTPADQPADGEKPAEGDSKAPKGTAKK